MDRRKWLVVAGARPSWLLRTSALTGQLDWNTGRAFLNGRVYQGEAAFKSLFSTFSTPACYITTSAGVLKLMPANSVHGIYGSDRGQLIEEARANLEPSGSDIGNGTYWNSFRMNLTSNAGVAPDGASTATLMTDTAVLGTHVIVSATAMSVTNAQNYTMTRYFKAGTQQYVQMILGAAGAGFGTQAYANFDIATGATGTVGAAATATITAINGGWYRCSVTAPATSTTTAQMIVGFITSSTAAKDQSYTGTGTTAYIWGAQLEAGSFATSYIPTTSSSATRAASSIIANDGTALATAAQQAKAMFFQTYGVGGGTNPSFLSFTGNGLLYFTNSTSIRVNNGSTEANAILPSGTYSGSVKFAAGMDATSFTAKANGSATGAQASAWAGNTGNVNFGMGRNSAQWWLNGYLTRSALGSIKGAFDGLTA